MITLVPVACSKIVVRGAPGGLRVRRGLPNCRTISNGVVQQPEQWGKRLRVYL